MGFDYPASKSIIYDVFSALNPHFKGIIIGNNMFTPDKAEHYIEKGYMDMVSWARLFISSIYN